MPEPKGQSGRILGPQLISVYGSTKPVFLGQAESTPIDYKAEAIALAISLGWITSPEDAGGFLHAHAKEYNVSMTGTWTEPHADDWWWLWSILREEGTED